MKVTYVPKKVVVEFENMDDGEEEKIMRHGIKQAQNIIKELRSARMRLFYIEEQLRKKI